MSGKQAVNLQAMFATKVIKCMLIINLLYKQECFWITLINNHTFNLVSFNFMEYSVVLISHTVNWYKLLEYCLCKPKYCNICFKIQGPVKAYSHYAVNGNGNVNLRFRLRFHRLFHTTTFLLYLYFPVKTAAVNVNLSFHLRFCPSVKASTV